MLAYIIAVLCWIHLIGFALLWLGWGAKELFTILRGARNERAY